MNIPSSLIDALDEATRGGLQAFRDSWFHGLSLATVAVALGVVLEGPEVFSEVLGGHEIPKWMKVMGLFGWLLIVIGVAGEFFLAEVVSSADGLIQTFDNVRLRTAERHSEEADQRAISAFNQAAEASTAAKTAFGQAALAARESGQNKLEAERLRLRAEQEANQRLELQRRVAPRSLTINDQKELVQLCKPFAPGFLFRKIKVGSYAMDAEAANLASQVIAVFNSAGISVENSIASESSFGGFDLGVTINGRIGDKLFISKLGHFISEKTDTPASWNWGDRSKDPLSPVRIWIGVKPVPIIPIPNAQQTASR